MFMQIPNSFSTFPVKDKKPLVQWSNYQDRLPSSIEIDTWTKQFGKYQKGIATGSISKILVLDDDGGLDRAKYKLPNTWTVPTPRGGKHYYFQWKNYLDDKITTKTEILPKVDVRGKGGFVVFYGWEKPYQMQSLAVPPQWLIDLLPNKNVDFSTLSNDKQLHISSSFQETLNNVHNGNRNDSFTRLAGSLRGRGYGASDIIGILSSKAREVGFELRELEIIANSVCRYEPNIRVDDSQAQNIEEFLKEQEAVEWICEGLIAKKSIGFVVGLPETGKTWMMIDLAVKCAKGDRLWLNKFPVKKQKVLFIDQERFKGETQRRFKAVLSANMENVDFKMLSDDLFLKSGTSIRLNLQHSFDAFRKELSEIKPDLVIVDSFVTFHTSEENNRKDIQTVLERVKELRNEFGCTFLFIHHESKMAFDKEQGDPSIAQMAGSIAIPAAAETVLTVRKQDAESSMVYHTKSTLASTQSPFLIKVMDINQEKTKIKVEAY
jgi:KaiC/GvpD/RAD55 family RecA-like ATPase